MPKSGAALIRHADSRSENPYLPEELAHAAQESGEISPLPHLQIIREDHQTLMLALQQDNLAPEQREELVRKMVDLAAFLKTVAAQFHRHQEALISSLERTLPSEEKKEIEQKLKEMKKFFRAELFQIVFQEFGEGKRSSRLAQLKKEQKEVEACLRRNLSPEEEMVKDLQKKEIIATIKRECPVYIAAVAELVKENQGFIRFVMKMNKGFYCRSQLEDIVSQMNMGLLRAIDGYDPNKGSFSTYATWWLKKSFFAAMEDFYFLSSPDDDKDKFYAIKKAEECLRTLLERDPSDEEVAVYLSDREQYKKIKRKKMQDSQEKDEQEIDKQEIENKSGQDETHMEVDGEAENLQLFEIMQLEKLMDPDATRESASKDSYELWKEDLEARAQQDKSKQDVSFKEWDQRSRRTIDAADVYYRKYTMGLSIVGSLNKDTGLVDGVRRDSVDPYVSLEILDKNVEFMGANLCEHLIDPHRALEIKEAREVLKIIFKKARLTEQEEKIILYRNGLGEGNDYGTKLTLEETAQKIGLRSRKSACNAQKKAEEKLKMYVVSLEKRRKADKNAGEF